MNYPLEITMEDVYKVISDMDNSDSIPLDEVFAGNILSMLNFTKIDDLSLTCSSVDEQTKCVYNEIKSQIIDNSLIETVEFSYKVSSIFNSSIAELIKNKGLTTNLLTPNTVATYASNDSRALMKCKTDDLVDELKVRMLESNTLNKQSIAKSIISALNAWADSEDRNPSVIQVLNELKK